MRPQASSVTSNFIKRLPWKPPYLVLYFQPEVQGISRQPPDLLFITLFSFHKILLLSGYLELSLFSKNWNSQRARTRRVSWGVGTSPAAAKATVPENSTVITSHGYQVVFLLQKVQRCYWNTECQLQTGTMEMWCSQRETNYWNGTNRIIAQTTGILKSSSQLFLALLLWVTWSLHVLDEWKRNLSSLK